MNKIDKAENKLKEFLSKWEEHYKLSDSELIHLLSKRIVDATSTEKFLNSPTDKVEIEPKQEIVKKLENSIEYSSVIGNNFEGIRFIKADGKYIYIDEAFLNTISQIYKGR